MQSKSDLPYLGISRIYLKVMLAASRGVYFPGKGRVLICPYCQKEIQGEPPMHEALISRKQVEKSPYADIIMSRNNCILPCTECHSKMVGVGGDTGFEIAARHLVEKEGYDNVRGWLTWVSLTFKQIGAEALRRFDAVFTKCPECDSEVLSTGSCMMGHWCGFYNLEKQDEKKPSDSSDNRIPD